MEYDSLFPLRGKKCVILSVSFLDIEANTVLDRKTVENLFRNELSQNLREYGIEVIDNDNSVNKQDISIAVQFNKIIQLDWLRWFRSYGESIVEVKAKVLADGKELEEAFVRVESPTIWESSLGNTLGDLIYLFFSGLGILKKYLRQAAERLSSPINAALIDHYAYGIRPEPLSRPTAT